MRSAQKISVVIPCYNESATIEEIVRHVVNANICGLLLEIIIVDDFSYDGTYEKALELASVNPCIRVFRNEINMGKGYSLRKGFAASEADIVMVQDADLEYSPSDYPLLLKPILDGRADVVIGSRFSGGGYRRVLYFWHSVGNKLLTFISNMFTNLNLTDIEAGYKVFCKEVLKKIDIKENRFGFEPEVIAKISRLNPMPSIYEVGIDYSGRTYEEGKKITWKDGIRALYCILRYNLFN